jgi:hypothetical protein
MVRNECGGRLDLGVTWENSREGVESRCLRFAGVLAPAENSRKSMTN